MFKFGNASTLANNDSWGRSDIKSVQAFAKEMENGASLGQAWQQTMAGATREAKEFVANGKKAGQTYTEIAASMNATATSAKVATIATTALNAVLTGLVIAAVTFAISKLAKAIDEFIRREEIAAQKAQEARDKINGLKQSFSDNEKTVNSLKQRYAELAQGVDKLGTAFQNQGRLNTEEYEEFLNISNQLADLYPQLTQGYDDNGNAILNLTGSVNTIVGSLDALIERSRQITRMQINEEMDKVWDDDIKNIENYKKEIRDTYTEVNDLAEGGYEVISKGTGYADYLEEYTRLLDLVNHSATKNLSITEDLTNQQRTMIANAMKEVLNLDFDVATDKDGLFDVATIFNFGKLGPENTQKLRDYFQEQIKEYQGLIYQTEDKIAQVNSQMQKNLVDYLSGDAVYLALDENSQRIVQGILSNFDISKIPEEANVKSWDDLTRWYQTNIIQSIANIDNKEIQQKIGQLFSGEGTLAETKDLYNVIYEYLVNQPGFDKDDPIILYLKTQLEDQQTIVDDALNRLLANVSDKDLRQQYAIGLRTLLEGASDEFVNWVANDLTIPEGTIYSEQKLLDMWEELHTTIEETTEAAKRFGYQAVDSLADAEAAINSLNELYWEVANKNPNAEEGELDLWGYADPAKINSIEQAFMKLAESEDEATKAQLNLALKEFEETLVRFPNDAEKAQEAINKLITAYINENEILSDLTEENQEYIKTRLESIGVTNAEEVVQSRLAITTKSTIEAVDALREAYNKYYETLNSQEPNSEEYKQAIDDLAGYVSKALQRYDENGNPIGELFEVTPEFVQEHLDDVQKMMNGDEEALRRLQRYIAETEFRAVMDISLPEEAMTSFFNELWDLIDWANLQEIDIGADLNNEAFIASLNQMADGSWEIAEQIAAYFKAIGIDLKMNQQFGKTGGGGMPAAVAAALDARGPFTGAVKVGESGLGNRAKYGPKPPSNDGKGGGSDKDETDPIVEKFEKDKEHLDWLREQDLISEQEYLDQLAILIQNSFGDNEKYADKYYEHMHDLMEQTKDYFDTAISAVNTILDKQIDKLEDLEKAEKKPYETANKEIDKNIRKLEKQTTSIDEVTKSLERQKETIQSKKIDPIQRQIDEIERTYIRPIEREIDALEKGKLRDLQDKINGVWGTDGLDDFIEKANREISDIQENLIEPVQKEIELRNDNIENIQKEIDKMNEANAQRKTALDLQRAAWELEKARNQRVNLVCTMPSFTVMC